MKPPARQGTSGVSEQASSGPVVPEADQGHETALDQSQRAAVTEIIGGLRLLLAWQVDSVTREVLARLAAAAGRLAQSLGLDVEQLAAEAAQPVAEQDAERRAGRGPALQLSLADLSRHHILVAAPDGTDTTALDDMLGALGATPVVAHGRDDIARCLQQDTFDLAIVGTRMHGVADRALCLDLISSLRRGGTGGQDVPVLALVARDTPTSVRAALHGAGADALLAMPHSCIASFGHVIVETAHKMQADTLPASARPAGTVFFDEDRLAQLLEIAGPVVARELLTRLRADLGNVRQGLLAGLDDPDGVTLRGQTHVLIALAGAVGAQRLQHLAEKLNAAAHGGAAEPIRALGRQVVYLVDHLIHFVGQQAILHDDEASGISDDDLRRICRSATESATEQEMR